MPAGFKYHLFNDGTIEIAEVNKWEKTLSVPQKIDDRLVTSIGEKAYAKCYSSEK